MKNIRKLSAIIALILSVLLLTGAVAEPSGLAVSAAVVARRERAIVAPVSGMLADFDLRSGQSVQAGETLFSVQPKKVYAAVDGTVSAVYAQAGDIVSAVTDRYGSLISLDYADRYELSCHLGTGYSSLENSDLRVGTSVYLRSSNKKHFADGLITAVDGKRFTVAIQGGDLVYNQAVLVYRTPDYDDKAKLARASISALQPVAVNASGTVLTVDVQPGDTVRKGDLLLTYVPDELPPELRNAKNICDVTAATELAVKAVSVTQGASVSRDQTLAIIYEGIRLCANVNEEDLKGVTVGQAVQITFDDWALSTDGVVAEIDAVGTSEETSQYAVYIDFEPDPALRYGMHATVNFN